MNNHNEANIIAMELSTSPPGTYKVYRGNEIGLDDSLELSMENYTQIRKMILHAVSCGCYIEVVSLRLMLMDYWLRFFIRNKGYSGKLYGLQFGHILSKANKHGIDKVIYEKINYFNEVRIKAIHGFIFGKTSVKEAEMFIKETQFLVPDVIIYVIGAVGEVITKLEGRFMRGDKILHVQENIDYIASLGPI